MAKIKNYILGLDVGVNSVGWAVVECQIEKDGKYQTYKPTKLVDLNSRIFQEMMEAKTPTPKNQNRRTKRGMRRRMSRLRGRRQALIKYLQDMKFLPNQIDEKFFNQVAQDFAKRIAKTKSIQQQSLPLHYLMSPMLMRAYALDHKLEPYEFACALLQLQKRRGYKSNRGAKYIELYEHVLGKVDIDEEKDIDTKPVVSDKEDDPEEKKKKQDRQKVIKGIQTLEKEMKSRNCHTIAEFVWHRAREEKKPLARITKYWAKDEENGEVDLYAIRNLYKKEFDAIWQVQAKHLKLNDEDQREIQKIIFYQRPIRNPPPKKERWKHLKYNDIGTCSFYPDKKRAAKALLESQDYRTWQSISNIRIKGTGERLSLEIKQRLAKELKDPSKLDNKDKCRLPWKKVNEIVEKGTSYKPSSDESEQNTNTGICGNRTALKISAILGDKWKQMDDDTKQTLVKKLIFVSDKLKLYKELISNEWGFSKGEKGEAFELATLELESGYMKHCPRVIKEVLQRMRDKGEDYYEACEHLGYHHKKEETGKLFLFPKDIPSIANPRVQKGLYEIRKVVNAVIKKYGRPSLIRLELARDLKASKKHRKLIKEGQDENRKLNEKAYKELKKETQNSEPSPTDIKKYRMWNEQKQSCLYCGQTISISDLLNNADIEHIIPQSISGQSYMNTILACRSCNQQKSNKTPHDAWGGTDQWNEIKEKLKTQGKGWGEKCIKYPELPIAKIKRILTEDPIEDEKQFVKRQLNDTRYIATTAKNTLAALGIDVRISNGTATAQLRKLWGLNKVLPRHPNIEQASKEKNRTDHRHHAIDAFIAAMTDNGRLIHLTKLGQLEREKRYEEYKDKKDEVKINDLKNRIKKVTQQIRQPDSWQDKEEILSVKIKNLLVTEKTVSHQNVSKIRGALHKDTNYGQASYITKLDIRSSTIKALKKYLANDENAQGQNDEATWILRQTEREAIRDWVEQQESLKEKEFDIPVLNGKVLHSIFLASRCYVVHEPVNKKFINRVMGKEWQEGTGSWIKDKEVHNQLQQWAESHKDNIEQGLKDDPPKMKSSKGEGNIIKSVRVAYKFGRDSITVIDKNRIYKLRSNHHIEIFTNDKEKRKGRIVSMKEAAERKNQKRSIINKEPSTEWKGNWEFSMSLAVNDMVLWNQDDPKLSQDIKDLGTPIFRVQTISNNDIRFRHHSIAITGDSHGLIRIRSYTDLNCQKIVIDALGDYQLLTE